jgi:anti-sigma regulatory factor (Ser/Thr protein kinase)
MMDEGSFRCQTLIQCHELTNLLAKACPEPNRVVVGLSELMVNALEHGNLGITYQEKTELIDAHGWRAEVSRRQKLPENAQKWIKVGFTRNSDCIRFEIEDQGPGFNWQQYVVPSPARIFDNHGRGILLAKMDSFDRVEYQGRGNRVVAEVMTLR